MIISLSERQKTILEAAKKGGPVTGGQLAEKLHVTRAALRADLAVLVALGLLDSRSKVGYFYTGKSALSFFTKELDTLLVRDIQSVPVVLPRTATAYDAVAALFLEDVGSVFVTREKGILLGIVSRKDLIKAALGVGNDLSKMPIQMVMTPVTKLIMTTPSESVITAARKIVDSQIDSLPVVRVLSANERIYEVVGRFTKTNLARLIVELAKDQT